MSNPQKIIVVCGPTGVGKTGFAIELALRFNGEIIGADSMQIYRAMEIGTAKPTAREQARVAHHMVDMVDPDADYDAAMYANQADACIARLSGEDRMPFVVGGTGLYIKALVHGLTEAAPADPRVRKKLRDELAASNAPAMHQRLLTCDPDAAGRIHPNDTHRVLRALEVIEITGKSIAHHWDDHGFSTARYDALYIGLTLPREMLYARINRRVDIMMAQGFVDEVHSLLNSGYEPQCKSMQALGYRHMVDLIQGRLFRDEAVETLKRDHRRYAKRQLTWFKANPDVNWLAPDQLPKAEELINDFHAG